MKTAAVLCLLSGLQSSALSSSPLPLRKALQYSGYGIDVHSPHPKTEQVAWRHCATYGTRAEHHRVALHTRQAFDAAVAFVDDFYKSDNNGIKAVILDSGCGRGLSTYNLAMANPMVPVLGIDRSTHRLSRNVIENASVGWDEDEDEVEEEDQEYDGGDVVGGKGSGQPHIPFTRRYPGVPNAVFVRAEISDFWDLVNTASDWTVQEHAIMYPNPYPKSKHLQRRWHGHASFPLLLSLGGKLTVRSNWKVYCEEMHLAISAVVPTFFGSALSAEAPLFSEYSIPQGQGAMTHFERKYAAAGLELYQTEYSMKTLTPMQRAEIRRGIIMAAAQQSRPPMS